MKMIIADNNIDEEYVKWIVRKEKVIKQARTIQNEYIHVFGKLLEENYRWKSACKYLQMSRAYCMSHKGIRVEEMEAYVQKEMEPDLSEWLFIQEKLESVKYIPFVSDACLKEVEEVFTSIVSKLQSRKGRLFRLARRAYLENDIKTLWKIDDQLEARKNKDTQFMKRETIQLKREVKNIYYKTSLYTKALSSVDNIQKRNKEIIEDTKSYKYYHKHLKKELRKTIRKDCVMQSFVYFSSFRGNDPIIVPNDDPLLLGRLLINLRFQV